MLSWDGREGETKIEEGEYRGWCGDRETKKKLKMGDGEGEQSVEGEQWSGERHLRDGERETVVKKDGRIWVMSKG